MLNRLEVAVKIKPATDAGYSEMLHLASGVALAVAPKEVLLRTIPALPTDGVCGFPDMSDPRYNTKKKTLNYLDSRIKAVSGLSETKLESVKMECLKILKKTRLEILSPMGPFSNNSGSNKKLMTFASLTGTLRRVATRAPWLNVICT